MKEVVKDLRNRLNLTQMDVAKLTGISIVTINRAENGTVKLTTYQKIIECLTKEASAKTV